MFRYRLRTLFIATAVLCVALGLWMNARSQVARCREDLEAYTLGFEAEPLWRRILLGHDPRYASATEIMFIDDPVRLQRTLAYLHDMPYLEQVILAEKQISDEDLQRLPRVVPWTEFALHDCGVTDQGLASLPSMPQVDDIRFDETRVTPAGVRPLIRKFPAARFIVNGAIFHEPNSVPSRETK